MYQYDKIKKNCRVGACKSICIFHFEEFVNYICTYVYYYYYIGDALIFNTLLTTTMYLNATISSLCILFLPWRVPAPGGQSLENGQVGIRFSGP